ncbi:hypothetical protein BpHYR1_044324 [Brachionus plicatilis]|uniref:G-protein coupled receptors family 1 profile domain-containing protein n=1 Tax=Brachionus plicatilis TaxID=10195 RepID=A0A3M7T636_BRAPC|nr:hypothetical protein BpHYR1_044324 [Brachionus plicatilis]
MVRNSVNSTRLSQEAVFEELEYNTWDYMTEVIFIVLIAVLTIPANSFLLFFYVRKMRRYKQIKHLNVGYVRVANSFHTYMIEICSFDTTIVFYLIVNTLFQFLYHLKKSKYESVYDVSNFTCKFFIYILRISGAMSNYLVFLLSLDRSFLILSPLKLVETNSHRLCLNTKYLTLFLFCICTIANVFRLELLNVNSQTQAKPSHFVFDYDLGDNKSSDAIQNLIQSMSEQVKSSECGPNIRSISFTIGDSTNALFWSIIIYNMFFSILPALGNLVVSVYLIKKRALLKQKLDVFIDFVKKGRKIEKLTRNDAEQVNNYEEIVQVKENKMAKFDFQLNEFHTEFLKTCTPCIAFSLTHVLLFLPYSIIEMVNQIKPSLTYMSVLQYMTYIRYFFYCSKFYLLFWVSYRFRREFRKFFRKIQKHRKRARDSLNLEIKHINDLNTINSVIMSNLKAV